MSRRRSPRRSSVSRAWYPVRMFATCAKGHAIHSGELALFVRAGYLKSTWCVEHALEAYGLEPPPPTPYEPGPEDSKSRSGGD